LGLKKKRTRRHLLEMGLNITSLIDVLTVLIFFLLKSMTVNSVAISPPANVNIPKTISETPLENSVSVTISNTELRFNNEVILTLENGIIDKKYFDSDNRTILSLKNLLDQKYAQKIHESNSEAKTLGDLKKDRLPANSKNQKLNLQSDFNLQIPAKIIIQADKDLPFHTIQFLLHTAALSGFTDYQFVVAPK
jgi:biopolymer transport protein ExbD